MSDHTLEPQKGTSSPADSSAERSWNDVIWTCVQPVLVLGTMLLVAFMVNSDWVHRHLFNAIMIVLPIPLIIVAEQIWTKRKDWLLKPGELAEDTFWLAMAGLLWVPLYSDYYSTPLSAGFRALRDMSPLNVALEPSTVTGTIACVLLLVTASSFVYYWLHRIQHESLLFWRMHATHHHITKMGCMRGDRTHPLEYATLMLGTPLAAALLGANDSVLAVAGAFGIWNGTLNHSNLPLKSMPVYDWFFATAQQHHVHHAFERRQADSNYGCVIILWDRLFGTYCGDDEVGQIGAGKCKPLSIKQQLAMAFYSDDKLKSL